MGKNNPKHSAKHRERIRNQQKYRKNTNLQKKPLFDSSGIPMSPGILSKKRTEYIHKKYEAILFQIEAQLLLHNREYQLTGREILICLSSMLWENWEWKKPQSHAPSSSHFDYIHELQKEKEVTPNIQLLYSSLLDVILPYIDAYLEKFGKNTENHTHRIMWDCIRLIYDSCAFWSRTDGEYGYIGYIQEFIPPEALDLIANDASEDINHLEQAFLTEQKESESRMTNRHLTNHLVRKLEINQSSYTKRELQAYATLSDGIFEFMKIDPQYPHSIPKSEILKKHLPIIERKFMSAKGVIAQNLEIYNSLLAINLYKQDYKKAMALFHEMQEKKISDNASNFIHASILLESENYRDAIQFIVDVLEHDMENSLKGSLLTFQAYCYEELQDLPKALQCLKDALELNPALDHIKTEISKIQAVMELNKTQSEPVRFMYTNSYDFLDLIAKTIYQLDFVHFQDNEVLQREILKIH